MSRLCKLICVLGDSLLRMAVLRHGVAASCEHKRALGEMRVSLVIDVGANRGQFSLLARRVFPDAQIVAFEPLPAAAAIFRQVFAEFPCVSLHECAIGNVSGESDMHISAADDSSSLLPISDLQTFAFPGTEEVGLSRVKVARLDEFLDSRATNGPALLKIDVQGYELEVLKGAESLLPIVDYVYCECSFREMYQGQALASEVVNWLHSRGFSLAGIHNVAYDRIGRAVQADFLFRR